MKYPYIGKSKHGNSYLFTSSNAAYSFINKSWMPDASQLIPMTNITPEYLQNTYGEVLSPEHAEFIIELAVNAKCAGVDICKVKAAAYQVSGMYFNFYVDSGTLWVSFSKLEMARSRGEKQITIPLPPKADKQELIEWPQVGDEVCWDKNGCTGTVKAISDGNAWCKLNNGLYHTIQIKRIKKPKTAEDELRDELIEYLNELGSSARYCFGGNELAADELLKSYDIKKNPH